ncbi:Part of AAA domain-containing protein [Dietzia kunjamensis subsp. schimae]|uniref:DNA 3'-5' helicase n=1 Tax=Dietzia kunjamensis subsp. schimae TaxID=498198 RepID=A0ABY1MXR7_9ACTN|nr:3'-5' exonuclease [Dietzia kunjamensis]MBB1014124.1 ATP-dependent helicase [Dietzia kunjamensis subsp. schimae]SMO42229.1 Part of AAA domain-containing protein [Dietzia kunjamensis subsp. schimae]
MATITLINKKESLDGSLRKRVFDTLSKLQADDTSVGAHVEPIKNAVDSRIRSVRVNDKFRALVFKIDGGAETHYVYVGTHPHDDAYSAAATMQLRVNPVNGVLTLVREQAAALDAKVAAEQSKKVAALEAAAKAGQVAEVGAPAGVAESSSTTRIADTESSNEPSPTGPGAPESGAGDSAEADASPAPAVVEDPTPAFAANRIDAEVLSRELGIDPAVSGPALASATLSELEAALDAAAPWERDALLGLAVGYSIDQVREELRLGVASDAAAVSDDEVDEFVRAVTAPAARMQFTFLGSGGDSTDVMREIIENGDFEAWTTFLHPSQEVLATRYRNGSYRVAGGAGTGKTVVALHRTRALVTRSLTRAPAEYTVDTTPRVLLTTFTRVLAASLSAQLKVLAAELPRAAAIGDAGVSVAGIDQTAMTVLNRATPAQLAAAGPAVIGQSLSSVPSPLSDHDERELWFEAVERAAVQPEGATATPEFLRGELETVVLAQGITTKAAYLKADRSGRGTPLNRKARTAVWSAIETYLAITRRENKQTFQVLGCLAAAVLNGIADAGGGRLLDHVVVDEAQDFHVGHWRLLRTLVAEGPNDLFIAEDGHQRIYGRPTVLSHYGINIRGRASRLTLNYRTTDENLRFAMGILSGETFVDTDGESENLTGYRSARSGPVPQVGHAENLRGELDIAEEHIRTWLAENPKASIGVLTHNRRDVDRIIDGLESRGIVITSEVSGVHVTTMHSSKGMEFTHVVLARVSEGTVPAPVRHGLTDEDREHLRRRERSLLYVAASRARDQLVVTTGAQPSPLLPAITTEDTAS